MTDTRLWLLGALREVRRSLQALIATAAARAEADADVLMPGYTHLQPAQTVRWSHWLLSHAAAWQRDDARLADLLPRVAMLPLGSGALAGNPFGVDRRFLAAELGFFGGVCPNSMDAVSDRDFVAETLFAGSLHQVHLSRWAEDLIIYSSGPYRFVQCSDAYATGSSLMPQKKNPDALELIRGKGGRSIGGVTSMLAVLKGTPTTYNKDFQESWELMFEAVDTLHDCIRIATGVLSTIKIDPRAMRAGLSADMLATDLAEYLVRKGQHVFLLGGGGRHCPALFLWWAAEEGGGWRHAGSPGTRAPCNESPARHATDPDPARRRALPRDAPHLRRGGEDGGGPWLPAQRPDPRRPAHHPPALRRRRGRGLGLCAVGRHPRHRGRRQQALCGGADCQAAHLPGGQPRGLNRGCRRRRCVWGGARCIKG